MGRWDNHNLLLISKCFISSIAVVMLSGCAAGWYMHNEEHDISGNMKAIAVDAKQRFVFTKPSNDDKDLFGSICAEPSPDALSSIVSGATIGANTGKESLKLALSNAESAASIGLRTQSIQLLRDGMYRICEAAYSGSITKIHVNELLKRYQDTMVAILAIESLTGAVRANQVVLTGKSSAQIGQELDKLSELYTKSLSDEQTAKTTLEEAKEASKTKAEELETSKTTSGDKLASLTEAKRPDCEDKEKRKNLTGTDKDNCDAYIVAKEDQTAKETANKAAADAQKLAENKHEVSKKLLDEQKKLFDAAANAGSSTAETKGSFDTTSTTTTKLSDQSAEHISNAVVKIVGQALLRNDVIDQCLDIYKQALTIDREKEEADKEARDATQNKNNISSQLEQAKGRHSALGTEIKASKNEGEDELQKLTQEKAEITKEINILRERKTKAEEDLNAANATKASKDKRAENIKTMRNSLACDKILSAFAARYAETYSGNTSPTDNAGN